MVADSTIDQAEGRRPLAGGPGAARISGRVATEPSDPWAAVLAHATRLGCR